jgi:hypothetical protein
MATVDKSFADNLVKHNGYYNGDTDNSLGDNPSCIEITQYINMAGVAAYGLTFDGEINKYEASDFITDPICYWKKETV